MGPALWNVRKGTQYTLRVLPVGGYVALEGEESPESQQAEAARDRREEAAPAPVPPEEGTGIPLNEAPVWQRMLVMVAGAVMNFVLGFVVLLILLMAQSSPLTSKVIYAVEDSALCGQTGLQAGDEIVAVNGRRCFVANDIIYELVRTEQYRADFTVLRDGQTVELPDVQFDTWTDEAGQVHMSLGFTVYGLAKTPRNVLREAGNSMLYYGRIIFTSLADLLRGRESINNLSGPVGIVTAIGQAASYGWQDLLQLLASSPSTWASSTCCPSRRWTAARWCSWPLRHHRPCCAGKAAGQPDRCGLCAAVRADDLCNLQRYHPAHHRSCITERGTTGCGS